MTTLHQLKLTAEELARLKRSQESLAKLPKTTGKRTFREPTLWMKNRLKTGI